ncbi:hypothetical protein F5Y16DRAFT_395264 [Xylariaceae sp. FL0255]|nr:hypothetical protein F5Y16DRAFT_395264 [Xylariaceae sp. FL0255]
MEALVSNPSDDASSTILGATLATTVLAIVITFLRLWVRIFKLGAFGWDDFIMAFTLILSVVGQGLVITEVAYGAGHHVGDVAPKRYSYALKILFITQNIYLFAICFVKLSVGAALLRVAVTKYWRVIILSLMAFTGVYTVASFLTIIFQCTDIRVQWDSSITYDCFPPATLLGLSYSNTVVNILTDVAFAIAIPIPMLRDLRVNRRTRYSLWAVFGLGAFGCVAAIVKLAYLVNYGKIGDTLWDDRNITIWIVTETNTGIIAGSLPSLRLLAKHVLGSTACNTNSNRRYVSSYGKSTTRKSSRWVTLSDTNTNDCPIDDSASERALNVAPNSHELNAVAGASLAGSSTVVVSGAPDHQETDWANNQAQIPKMGIQKTVTTTMAYSNQS